MRRYLPAPSSDPADVPTVAVVAGDSNVAGEIRNCIHDYPVHIAFEAPVQRLRQELIQRLQTDGVNAVLLDMDAAGDIAASIVRDIKSVLPECHILGLGKAAETDAILGALRAGCSDYLYPPLRQSLIGALARLSRGQARPKQAKEGTLVGLLSAKGGCGATTVACHVARELRRLIPEKVLLADLDLTSGLVAFTMKAASRHDILDAIYNTNRLDESYWRALVSDCSGLDVIAAPAPSCSREMPSAAIVAKTLSFLRSQYRYVVADLGRGVNPFIEGVVDEIDQLFLVTTADTPALHQAGKIAEHFTAKNGLRCGVQLILNRFPQQNSRLTAADASDLTGLPVFCEISNGYAELHEASLEGKLVPAKSRLGKDFLQAAQTIAHVPPKKKAQPWFHWQTGWLRAAAGLLRG